MRHKVIVITSTDVLSKAEQALCTKFSEIKLIAILTNCKKLTR